VLRTFILLERNEECRIENKGKVNYLALALPSVWRTIVTEQLDMQIRMLWPKTSAAQLFALPFPYSTGFILNSSA
jgi:hypothetical protein